MRNFLLLCMAALCCLACNDSKIVTVTVTNPLAMDRSDEMVEVSMTEISNLLNLADTAQIVVLNVEGEQVPYQVTYDDKLIFPATVAANASAAYTVQAGTPACIAVQRFVPFHHLVVHKSGGGRCFCVIPALAARKIPHNAEATVLIAIGRVILDTVIVRVYSTGRCSCVHSELHLRMSVRTDFRHFILRAGCYQQSGK